MTLICLILSLSQLSWIAKLKGRQSFTWICLNASTNMIAFASAFQTELSALSFVHNWPFPRPDTRIRKWLLFSSSLVFCIILLVTTRETDPSKRFAFAARWIVYYANLGSSARLRPLNSSKSVFLIRLKRTLHIILVHILHWLQLVLLVGPISSASLILKWIFSKIRGFLVVWLGGFLCPARLEKFNKSVIWHVVPRIDEPFPLSANIIVFILLKVLVKRLVLNWGSVDFRIQIFHIGKSHVPTC